MNLQLRVDSIKRKNIDFIFNKPEKKRFTELITCTCSKSDECVETEDDSLSLDKDKAYEIFQMQLNESYIYKEKENIFAIIEDITETYNKSKRLENIIKELNDKISRSKSVSVDENAFSYSLEKKNEIELEIVKCEKEIEKHTLQVKDYDLCINDSKEKKRKLKNNIKLEELKVNFINERLETSLVYNAQINNKLNSIEKEIISKQEYIRLLMKNCYQEHDSIKSQIKNKTSLIEKIEKAKENRKLQKK